MLYSTYEQLVLVELTGIIDSDILQKCDNKCKILGINTERPFLQVDKYVFAGEYEDVLGTCVIFEETPDQGDGDNAKAQLKYKCHTVKKLNMTRTFLTEKKEGDEGGGKIEWFHVKDESSPSWPQMICSFAQGIEDQDESQSEEESQGQLDRPTEETVEADQSFDSEGKRRSNSEKGPFDSEGKRCSDSEKGPSDSERGPSDSEGKRRCDSEKGPSDFEGKGCSASEGEQHFNKLDNDTDMPLSTVEHDRQSAKEVSSAQPED
ncbi:general transcription factor 3C polypeptide 6 isoform X2 [Pseudophryne corroboree]|uniref:general transcription factor 3C polypeptide 6 isoform X2 n=1 Tax=Pseudophryne corroboree TaxID=495146 RepID=UPI0030816575